VKGGLFLGIDGGASKTAGAMLSANGRLVATVRTGGSAIVGKPSIEACAVLAEVVAKLCSAAGCNRGRVGYCAIGLNGVDFADTQPMQHAEIARAIGLPPECMTLVNDGIVALWAATPTPAAALLQHGSGFTGAYRRRHGAEVLFDHLHVGDTYDLRRGLVAAVARMIDGRQEPTPLKERTLAQFAIADEAAYCEAVYRGTIQRERLKNTAPLVFEAWLAGDPEAAELVRRAVEDYALAAKAMVARIGCDDPDVVFGGGVILRGPDQFWALLAEKVRSHCPNARTKRPDLPPEIGAAIMAAYVAERRSEQWIRAAFEARPRQDLQVPEGKR
jgi:N-acetylglucosamine kinase-like BadF-type ATPase